MRVAVVACTVGGRWKRDVLEDTVVRVRMAFWPERGSGSD